MLSNKCQYLGLHGEGKKRNIYASLMKLIQWITAARAGTSVESYSVQHSQSFIRHFFLKEPAQGRFAHNAKEREREREEKSNIHQGARCLIYFKKIPFYWADAQVPIPGSGIKLPEPNWFCFLLLHIFLDYGFPTHYSHRHALNCFNTASNFSPPLQGLSLRSASQ